MLSDWPVVLACGLAAYLLGSIPTAYIAVRLGQARDIRRLGSGNVGATNAFKQAGVLLGSLVMLADTGKGVVAVLAPMWVGAPHWTMFVTTTLTLAGHNWPVFLNFRGGKGVAVILGASLSLVPWLTLAALAPAGLVIARVRNVTIGSTLGIGLLNVRHRTGRGPYRFMPLPQLPGFGHLSGEHPPSNTVCRQEPPVAGPFPRHRYLELASREGPACNAVIVAILDVL